MRESLPSDNLTEMWYAFLTFAWKRTSIFAVSFSSCYCRQGSVEKKVLFSSSVAAPLVSCRFLCYGASSEFLSNTIKRLQKLFMDIKLYALRMFSDDGKD